MSPEVAAAVRRWDKATRRQVTGRGWIPYDASDIERGAGMALAAELRASGDYVRVRVDSRPPDIDGRRFVRVFVDPVAECDYCESREDVGRDNGGRLICGDCWDKGADGFRAEG